MELSVTDDEQNSPVVSYSASSGDPVIWRRYRIHLKPESRVGQEIRNTILNLDTPPTITRDAVLEHLRDSQPNIIEHVDYTYGYILDFRKVLLDAGFKDVTFWVLPSATEFARALQDDGLLQGLTNDQLVPYLKALVRSSPTFEVSELVSNLVTAVNEK
jgi:hypothetical protein